MAAFIAGDWGLTHLRLWLCDDAGNALEMREGPGVKAAGANVPEVLAGAVAGWENVPLVLCGMVGSTLGWRQVPYVASPATPADIARGALAFSFAGRKVLIAPGVRAQSVFGAPDVMRGEETQIVGAIRTRPALQQGRWLLCLPGTHAKWIELSDGSIQQITTAVSGELFALLSQQATVGAGAGPWDGKPSEAFRRGLARSRAVPLLHALFEARARRLTDDLRDSDMRAFLSGLMIGADVVGLRAQFAVQHVGVVLVGAPALTALYAEALKVEHIEAVCLSGEHMALAGLTYYFQTSGL